ncbi:hypothetical protein EVAR_32940_1 [Eumeta japonica]|uniref:Uncharacterized protein n=1 Tax=Eumeta variegata TaxID=151549 RepID=A0A4C1X6K4_EUMVA|nr:hypothetical protein EVAR_32940_1 [Eumeta japonica]
MPDIVSYCRSHKQYQSHLECDKKTFFVFYLRDKIRNEKFDRRTRLTGHSSQKKLKWQRPGYIGRRTDDLRGRIMEPIHWVDWRPGEGCGPPLVSSGPRSYIKKMSMVGPRPAVDCLGTVKKPNVILIDVNASVISKFVVGFHVHHNRILLRVHTTRVGCIRVAYSLKNNAFR